MTNLLVSSDKMVLHSQNKLSVARFPAAMMLQNLIDARFNYSAQRIFISSTHGLVPVKTKSQRYKLFRKARRCITCGRIGDLLSLEKYEYKGNVTFTFNLYCIENNKAILMTKDHIIPRSKGGPNTMENYQTMCEYCNRRKGSRLEMAVC